MRLRIIVPLTLSLCGCGAPFVPSDLTTTVQHPATSGNVEPHKIYEKSGVSGHRQSTQWFSVTELSSERICLDYALASESSTDKDAKEGVQANLDYARGGYLFFNGSGNGKVRPEVEVTGPVFAGTHAGTRRKSKKVKTGRIDAVCVEDLVNQYGTVVGCARYEEQEQVKSKGWQEAMTIYAYRGAARFCAPNDGLVAPDDPHFDFTFGGLRLRLALTAGLPKEGEWGGLGGESALAFASEKAADGEPSSGSSEAGAAGKPTSGAATERGPQSKSPTGTGKAKPTGTTKRRPPAPKPPSGGR